MAVGIEGLSICGGGGENGQQLGIKSRKGSLPSRRLPVCVWWGAGYSYSLFFLLDSANLIFTLKFYTKVFF